MTALLQSFEPWAAWWTANLWQASWQGAIALVVVWAVARFFTSLSPRVVCWLWRLACLKLLLSLAWTQPVSLAVLPAEQAPAVAPIVELRPARPTDLPPMEFTATAPQETKAVAAPVAPPARPTLAAWLALVWLVGVFARAGFTLRQWRFVRRLCRAAEPASSETLWRICREEGQRLGLRRLPALRLTRQADGPLLAGIWRPTVVLPVRAEVVFSEPELRLMLAHELAHLARRDLLWNWLPTLVGWAFFFHPLVWLLSRRWSEAQEAACDELLIQRRGVLSAEFARLLLKLATATPQGSRPALLVADVLGTYRNLERRIVAMSRVRPFSRPRLAATACVLVVLAAPGMVPWRLVAQESPPQKPPAQGAPAPQVPLHFTSGTWDYALQNPADPTGGVADDPKPPAVKQPSEAHLKAMAAIKEQGGFVERDERGRWVVSLGDQWTGANEGLDHLSALENVALVYIDCQKLTPDALTHLRKIKGLATLQLGTVSDEQLARLEDWDVTLGDLWLMGSMSDKAIATVATWPNLRRLQINGQRRTDADKTSPITDEGVALLKACPRLEMLSLSDCPLLTGARLGEFASLPKLNELWLLNFSVSDEGFAQAARLPHLKRLIAGAAKITAAGFASLEQMTGLETLHLNDATAFDDDAAAYLARLPQLRYLGLYDVKLTDAGLAHLAGLTELQSLGLWQGQYTDAGLAHLKGLRKLETLTFSEELEVSDAGLAQLADLIRLKRLQLPAKQVTDDGLSALAGLEALEYLDLHGAAIRGPGLAVLAKLGKIKTLDLSETQLTDTELPRLEQFPLLEKLKLDGTQVTDNGLPALAKLTRLKSLSLWGTQITDAGLEQLAPLKELTSLEVAGTQVTKAAVERLKVLLPQVRLSGEWTYRVVVDGIVPVRLDNVEVTEGTEQEEAAEPDSASAADPKNAPPEAQAAPKAAAEPDAATAAIEKLGGVVSEREIAGQKRVVVEISGNWTGGPAGLAKLKDLPRLDWLEFNEALGLDVSGNLVTGGQNFKVTDEWFEPLAPLTGLRAISVRNESYLTDKALAALAPLTQLETLEISGRFTPEGLAPLAALPKLRNLNLGGLPNDEALAQVARIKTLESLSVECPGFTDEGLRALANLTGLENLWLSSDAMTDAGLASLAPLVKLRKVSLVGKQLTGAGLKSLAGAKQLKLLQFPNPKVADRLLEALASFTELETLYVPNTHITGPGLKHLKPLAKLKEIGLERTPVDDEGLAQLSGHPSLEGIWLDATQVGDQGLAQLVDCPKLRFLCLLSTEVTDASLASLVKLKSLDFLVLTDTRVSEAAVEQLKAKMPQLKRVDWSPRREKNDTDRPLNMIPIAAVRAHMLEVPILPDRE